MLLTKREPIETNYIQFTSALTTRSALHAKVKLPGLGETDVFCTHLAADLSGILAYPGTDYASYQEEQAAQIEGLLEFAAEHGTSDHILVLGDMNTGPDSIENNYQRFVDDGFANPYVDAFGTDECTYCSANTLNGGSGDGGVTIDHVLTKSDASAVVVAKVLTQTTTIETNDGSEEHHLSDHYGVQLILE